MNQSKPTTRKFYGYAYTAFCIFLFLNGLSVIDYTVFTQGFVEIEPVWIS